MKLYHTLILAFALPAYLMAQPSVELVPFAHHVTLPTDMEHTTDSRLYVSEQLGYIRIIDRNGNVSARPFLDVHSLITQVDSAHSGEQGLLGFAFSPSYATDGFIYTNYTNKVGIGNSVISRWHVSANRDSIDAASQQILLTLRQPYSNHNGGCLRFGADGYLYCGFGDGGDGGDPGNRAQNLDSLFGKILRLDVSGGGAYSIPPTNPFSVSSTARPEIWAYGLRNPWKFTFDAVTHDMWIGDVGQDSVEEIDMQPAASTGGENYGWRCYEGTRAYDNSCSSSSSFVPPVAEYRHRATSGCSITGGYVYRGAAYPDMNGYYFYADFCNSKIYTVSSNHNTALAGSFSPNLFTTFGTDSAGELYIADKRNSTIYRVQSTATGIPDISALYSDAIIPNPNSGKFTYRIIAVKAVTADIEITDITGKIVYRIAKELVQGENSLALDMSISSGMYVARLKTSSGTLSRKFTVQD